MPGVFTKCACDLRSASMATRWFVLVALASLVTVSYGSTDDYCERDEEEVETGHISRYAKLRLNFAGSFLADTSTYNNDRENFNIGTFDPLKDPSWNPKGSNDFRLVNCTVTQVCLADGRCSSSTVAAKLVDLDTDDQKQSQIWGLVVGVDGFLKGDFVPRSFNHMHYACEGSDCSTVRRPTGFSAVFLSTLRDVTWINGHLAKRSTFIQQVRSLRCMPGFELYVKLNVHTMVEDSKSPDFPYGRVVGTIYAAVSNDPLPYGPYKRMLWGEASSNGRSHVPFYVDVHMKSVVLDFANSVKFNIKGNVVEQSSGPLFLIQYNEKIQGCALLNNEANLGEIRLGGNDWFQRTAGIIELSMKYMYTTIGTIQSTQLAVVQQISPTRCEAVWKEGNDGLFVEAIDDRVVRKEPNSKWPMRFRTFQFGRSADEIHIEASLSRPLDDLNPAIHIDSSEPSGKNGISTIIFRSSNPGNPRKEQQLDGQVYKYGIKAKKGADGIPCDVKDLTVSVHLYSDYTFTPGKVTWYEHVYPIFQQYANLYPVMKPIINLASYEDVTRKKDLLKHALTLPETHPNYMPLTRDLSPKKREMILSWLNEASEQTNSHPSLNQPRVGTATHTLDELKRTLQIALQLELATIPPYLSALFSIKDGDNREVAALIKSVIVEEMKHMSLVSNLLNAIGGAPDLNNPSTVPSYPATLPGGANPGLVVTLARCSLSQIRTVFQGIERPDCEIARSDVVRYLRSNRERLITHHNDEPKGQTWNEIWEEIKGHCSKITTMPQTIGAIYIHQILCPMVILETKAQVNGGTLFTGARQITSDQWLDSNPPFAVDDLRSAIRAILTITTEGEGGDPCDPSDEEGELSHFFKFAEIVHGRRLKQRDPNATSSGQCFDDFKPCDDEIKCNKTFNFAGRLVPFYEDGVWPTVSNPHTERYPPGSQVRKYSDNFNKIYTGLLQCVHDAFNGNPEKMKVDCMGMMSSLTAWAKRLVRTPIDSNGDPEIGPNAAPTFEFHNPSYKDAM
ncbi:Hypp4598 [Branchiostoma lanceolatum]|uniref:Hypp4598 protein n=1 Tax=Branchiostoma lanceolatum TaxID=7740 RepID=A0A8K0AB34_BRALA|nr:Hypp4598 [Branchiostoma lanceolatum]